jgi:hypothetical protein
MTLHYDQGAHTPLCERPSADEWTTLTVIKERVTCERCLARLAASLKKPEQSSEEQP